LEDKKMFWIINLNYCQRNDTISIAHDAINESLSGYTVERLSETLVKYYPDVSKRIFELKPLDFYYFINEIKENDYVFVRNHEDDIIKFGRVNSKYTFSPTKKSYRHYRNAKLKDLKFNFNLKNDGILLQNQPVINLSEYPNLLHTLIEFNNITEDFLELD